MSAETAKSLRSLAPFDRDTADDFGVLKFTGGVAATETTHSANALPASWVGREVGMICTGGTCWVAFSTNSSAAVDRGVAATAAGASAQVGLPLPDSLSIETRVRLPDVDKQTLYFVRESSATGVVVYMRRLG